MIISDTYFDEAAVDRLQEDRQALSNAVAALRDSITGSWDHPNGGVYVSHIACGAQTALYNIGRLANTVYKAADAIGARSDDAYIDHLGDQTPAGDEVRAIAERLRQAARELERLYNQTHHDGLMSDLATIGQR